MEFKKVLLNRRSCRSFKEKTISDEYINQIIKLGSYAPSPLNLQPWEFIIIKDDNIKKEIRKIAENAKEDVIMADGPDWVKNYDISFIEDASILIVVLSNPLKSGLGKYFGQKYGAIQATSACIQNMLLAATELQIASLWFTFFDPLKIKKLLEIPTNLEIAGIVALGYSDKEVKTPKRKEPKVFFNSYPQI